MRRRKCESQPTYSRSKTMACSRAAVSAGNLASVAKMKGPYASMQLGRKGDVANPPLLYRMQAQDLRDQVRGYGHSATLIRIDR